MSLKTPSLDSLDLRAKNVLVRADLNVPLSDAGEIGDDTRVRGVIPTLREIIAAGGRPVVMSHLGRPKGEVVEALRLNPIAPRLAELLGAKVEKLNESAGEGLRARVDAAFAAGAAVVLLENVRFHPGETKGDMELAAAYAKLGDVFVNDAFGTSHRDHASVCGIAKLLPSAAGRLLQKEIEAFGRVLENPERPLVAILGGAKVSDKLKVIDNLVERVDALLIGGGMAYTFLAAQGHSIGNSLVQEDQFDMVRAAMARAEERGVKLLLPVDHVVAEAFAADAPSKVVGIDIPDGWLALDIGPKTRGIYCELLKSARTVVWNGPMGVFEMKAFQVGTESVGRAVADCPGYTVVGGGDSVAAVELFGLGDRISHISTGGGASLELLEGKVLPGIAALQG